MNGRPSIAEQDSAPVSDAVIAFDRIADVFDDRFENWESVAAQRRAIRRAFLRAFPRGSTLLELGGGTGSDAIYLAQRDRRILMTDGAPAMVARAAEKAHAQGLQDRVQTACIALEQLPTFAAESNRGETFDGAYSNFASFNCIDALEPVARGLAHMLRPGAPVLLVVFGPWSLGEIVVQLALRQPRTAFRRFTRGPALARLGGRAFTVRYWRPSQFERAFAPLFTLDSVRGIGIFVPPSAAEPAMSRLPGCVRVLEALDRVASAPLAYVGDHLLLRLIRTTAAVRSTDG
jgi:SAM-dependent methyltransferase